MTTSTSTLPPPTPGEARAFPGPHDPLPVEPIRPPILISPPRNPAVVWIILAAVALTVLSLIMALGYLITIISKAIARILWGWRRM